MSSDSFFDIESIKVELESLPKFLTLKQAAEILQVDYFTVYRLVIVGEIDATKVGGVWRMPKCALKEYLEKRIL
jgi:excisionase family DNA binding protein